MIDPTLKYMFSEPFKTQFERALRGIGLSDRSRGPQVETIIEEGITEKQSGLIRKLGYTGEFPKTKKAASLVINRLLKKMTPEETKARRSRQYRERMDERRELAEYAVRHPRVRLKRREGV